MADKARPPHKAQKSLRSMIHGDLLPRHVHRSNNEWWIIDWGMTKRERLLAEVFRPYYWFNIRTAPRNVRAYWAWLRGDYMYEKLPQGVRFDIELFLNWLNAWHGVEYDIDTLRYHIIVNSLEKIFDQSIENDKLIYPKKKINHKSFYPGPHYIFKALGIDTNI